MKTTKLTSLLLLMVAMMAGFAGFSQDKKADSKDKKNKKSTTVVMKIVKDDNGKVTTIDTTYTTDEEVDPRDFSIRKNIETDGDEMKITVDLEKELADLGIQMDSLHKMTKSFKIIADGDPNLQWFDGDGNFDFPSCCPQGQAPKVMNYISDPASYYAYSPYGQVQKLEIKKQKHGKKIIIYTSDDQEYNFMPPPPPIPPAPPVPGGKHHSPKKVVIIQKDGKN